MRKFRHGCIVLLLWLIAIPLVLEGGLRIFDPLGAWRYTHDSATWGALVTPDPTRDYHLASGTYPLSNWMLTILPDGTRAVPDTNVSAPCSIVMIGDSQTFALGVSDADSWPNLLARKYPKVHIINAGLPGTNIEDALLNISAFKADGYLYLLSNNDADGPPPVGHWHFGEDWSALQLYLWYLHPAAYEPGAIADEFWGDLNATLENPKVSVAAYDSGDLIQEVKLRERAVAIIALYKGQISRIDHHANPQGNIETADAIAPVFEALVKRICKGVVIDS